MKKASFITETYTFYDDAAHMHFYVDIVENETEFEAWIYSSFATFKMLVFGAMKQQQPKIEFIRLVNNVISDYAPLYMIEYLKD